MTEVRRIDLFRAAGAALLAALVPGCTKPAADAPEPWTAGLVAGLQDIERHSMKGRHDDALEVADRMVEPDVYARFRADLDRWTGGALERALGPLSDALDWIGIDALSSRDLGEVEFARATALLAQAATLAEDERKGALSGAEASFERARAAGSGVRADAVCGLGVLDLQEGEAVRATLPEVSGAQPAPTAPAAPGAAPAEDDDAPDPLEIARGRYLAAKDHFVEVLRMAPASEEGDRRGEVDAVTRAGVELCIRRLRELDQIEQQREEQEQQEQEENQDGEPNGDPQDGEDGEPQDGEREPGEEPPPEEQEQEGEPEGEPEEESDASEEEQPAEQELEEREMTKEELERFLEEARKNQEEGEERRKTLIKKRKVPTQRDW